MRVNRRELLPLLALVLTPALAACGGSGSSGFDISSPLTEDAVIAAVVDTGECGESGGLAICRAGDTAEAMPGMPTPLPSADPAIDLVRPQSDGLACVPSTEDGSCDILVSFLPGNLPGATYRVAVRGTEPRSDWVVAPEVAFAGGPFEAVVRVPQGVDTIQIAVLVFDGGRDVEPGAIETLASSGATFAFVSGDLAVAALVAVP